MLVPSSYNRNESFYINVSQNMAPSVRQQIDPRQKLQIATIMDSQLSVEGKSLPFRLFEVKSHCPQSKENVIYFQSGFWSHFLEQQNMLNHHPETSIAIDAV